CGTACYRDRGLIRRVQVVDKKLLCAIASPRDHCQKVALWGAHEFTLLLRWVLIHGDVCQDVIDFAIGDRDAANVRNIGSDTVWRGKQERFAAGQRPKEIGVGAVEITGHTVVTGLAAHDVLAVAAAHIDTAQTPGRTTLLALLAVHNVCLVVDTNNAGGDKFTRGLLVRVRQIDLLFQRAYLAAIPEHDVSMVGLVLGVGEELDGYCAI